MIGELLNEIMAEGWLVNNLYQVDGGLWRCNLRKLDANGDWFTNWVEEPTLEDALWASFEQTGVAEFSHIAETKTTIDRSQAPSLLAKLGLTRKTPFTDRRL